MHHLRALRAKKSKVELKDEQRALPDEQSSQQETSPKDEQQYETLDIDPSRAIAVQNKAVSPAVIIKGITTAVDVAKDVSEIVENVQDAKAGKASPKDDEKGDDDGKDDGVVSDLGEVIENVQSIVNTSKDAKASSKKGKVSPAVAAHNSKMAMRKTSTLPQEPPKSDPNAPKGQENQKKAGGKDNIPAALAKANRRMEIVASRGRSSAAPGPPAVVAPNAKIAVKASSTPSQKQPDAPKGQEDQKKAGGKDKADVPPALAKALKRMEIVAARSEPPATPRPSGVNRHMKAVAGKTPPPGTAGDKKDGKPKEPEADPLPPNLAKALRSMQIVGAKTPEGRALAAEGAKIGHPGAEGEGKKPQIKIRAATDLKDDSGDDKNEDKDKDLPPELKASRRHMEIFAASHKSGGPAPVAKIAKDAGLVTEDAPDESEEEDEEAEGAEGSGGQDEDADAVDESGEEGEDADAVDDQDASTESVSSASSQKEAATQTEDGDQPAEPVPGAGPQAKVQDQAAKPGPTTTVPGDKPAPTDPSPPTSAKPTTDTAAPAPTEKTTLAPGPSASDKPATATDKPAPTDKTSPSPDIKGPVNPTPSDIFRYRYHHGVNLGSIYVLEKWLTPSAFPPDAPDEETSELSCVSEWVKEIGLEATSAKFSERWAQALREEDWNWLVKEAHCNAIRLPIGHFTLGPEYCKGTPFEEFGGVYKNAWASVKKFVEMASGRGIGVLIDLHALPGGANPGEHSGTNSKVAKLWDDTANLDLATQCVEFIAREVKDLPGVIGVQLCNEADYDAKCMYEWYDKVVAVVAAIDPKLPLFISDAWDLEKAAKYVLEKNKPGGTQNPLLVDT